MTVTCAIVICTVVALVPPLALVAHALESNFWAPVAVVLVGAAVVAGAIRCLARAIRREGGRYASRRDIIRALCDEDEG